MKLFVIKLLTPNRRTGGFTSDVVGVFDIESVANQVADGIDKEQTEDWGDGGVTAIEVFELNEVKYE
jgi:hypothetical protein